MRHRYTVAPTAKIPQYPGGNSQMPQSRQKKIYDTVELTLRATLECTRSLHSDTECRPVEVIHASSDEVKMAIKTNFDKAQQTNLDRVNSSRQNRVFENGEKVHLRNNNKTRK